DAQRPILQRISDSQLRREHTASALRLITHRISRKISRGLPFPPASMPANVGRAPLQSDGGREVELNFESDILHDDDIQPLAVQLGTHVDNIRANLEQTDHLTPQLARSRAALRAVLLRHLDLRQYEQVVLG
ncbi:hypothetical protein E4U53_003264, partial [Claviceps sorghi]